jgi:hypothetical protein
MKGMDKPAAVRKAEDLATLFGVANEEYGRGEELTRQGTSRFVQAGEALLKAKEQSPRGTWLKALKEKWRYSQGRAYQCMDLAKVLVTRTLAPEELEEEWQRIQGNAPVIEEEDDETPPRGEGNEEEEVTGKQGIAENGQEEGEVDGQNNGDGSGVETAEDEESDGTSEVPVQDEAGVSLPLRAVEAFSQLPEWRAVCRTLDEAAREIARLGKGPVAVHAHWQSAQSQLRAARKTLWAGRPAHACPYCRGEKDDCQACRGHGFVTASTYEQAKEAGVVT